MRIAILTNNATGLYKFRKELIEQLVVNHEVYTVHPYDKSVERLECLGCKFVPLEFNRRRANPFEDFRQFHNYIRLLKKIKPDFVITYTIKPNIYGALASRIKRIPYAVNVTGLGTAFEKDGLLQKLVTIMYKTALKRAQIVFFENSANRGLFVNEKIIRQNKTCVLNGAGVNVDTFSILPYPDNTVFKFLFIGRVMKEKGVEELFAAMKRLVRDGEKCFLNVVGPLEENYKEELERCELEGWLKYHGSQDDVRPFIETCDCFVLPSYHEGMANTNLESASSGRPIITSNIPGCREAIVEGVSGLLCRSKDVDSLYRTMKQMLGFTRGQRELMGIVGRKHMEDVFDKKLVVQATLDRLFG